MRKGFLRELLFTGFLILLGSIEAISGTPTPHLQPEDGFFGFTMLNPYYEAVSDRLQLTSTFRKCQAVFLPSFSEESAVYLIYNQDNKKAPPIVVSKKFKRQLWTEMHRLLEANSGKKGSYSVGPEAQQKILPEVKSEIIQLEAPIDFKTADVLERVWKLMITHVHYPDKAGGGLDGESCHFANCEMGLGCRTGKVWSPDEGTPSYELVELAKSLREYPGLREVEREKAAQAMLKRAQILLARIENKKEMGK